MRRLSSMAGYAAIMAASALAHFGTPTALSVPTRAEPVLTRKEALRKAAAKKDAYFGIKSRGRTGAKFRAGLFRIARRKVVGNHVRSQSNPFKHKARRDAFDVALAKLTPIIGNGDDRRDLAMKAARQVHVPRKAVA